MKNHPRTKVKRLSDLSKIVSQLKKEGKTIVHCHGVFDLIHPGHIRYFEAAKKRGDITIVTLTADSYVNKGPGRPIFSEKLRAEFLATISYIDYVSIDRSESAVNAILSLKPSIYLKGPDYRGIRKDTAVYTRLQEEEEAVKKVGGKLEFSDDVIFSSTKLINSYIDTYPAKTQKYLDFLKKKYTTDDVIDKLRKAAQIKILIIGDAIIDQYDYSKPVGKSSKEPVIVNKFLSEESYLGGALASANHVASISKNITLVSLLGRKRSYQSFIEKRLKSNIKRTFFFRPDTHTVVKRRYVDIDTKQKLFQVSYIHDEQIDKHIEKNIKKFLKKEIPKHDLVIVNDFGHGFLTDGIVRMLCKNAKYLALNVQANSANYGFNVVTKYKRAHYVCLDEQEIRLATHDKYGDVRQLMKRIGKQLKAEAVMVTRGYNGSVTYSEKDGFIETPALTSRVIDRVGAGDALFAITSPSIYSGMDIELVSFLGNIAGALQVQVIGNSRSITFDDLHVMINRLLK